MKLLCAAILSGILLNFIRVASSCSPIEGWLPLEPTARVRKADFVIYGTVRASPSQGPKKGPFGFYSALFEVHCIFKGGILPQFVNVSGFGFDGGLCTRSVAYLNKTYIAFIRKDENEWTNSTRFVAHQVNTQPATIHVKHKLNKSLKQIVKMVKENATLPMGVTKDSWPGCPTFSPFYTVRRRPCSPKLHKHKRRRHKKCHVSSTPSTQFTGSSKELTISRKSFRVHTKETLVPTATKMQGNVDFLQHSHSSASRTRSIRWCFVLICHGLVLVVVNWHQT